MSLYFFARQHEKCFGFIFIGLEYFPFLSFSPENHPINTTSSNKIKNVLIFNLHSNKTRKRKCFSVLFLEKSIFRSMKLFWGMILIRREFPFYSDIFVYWSFIKTFLEEGGQVRFSSLLVLVDGYLDILNWSARLSERFVRVCDDI